MIVYHLMFNLYLLEATTVTFNYKKQKKICFILAGVTGSMTKLTTQHSSFSRLCENIELRRMNKEELNDIIVNALRDTGVGIKDHVKKRIIILADRFPQPVQLLGYHTFLLYSDSILELNGLNRALNFIINQLKHQEFSELYEKTGINNAPMEKILGIIANSDKYEISLSELSRELRMEQNVILKTLNKLEKKILIRSRNTFNLCDPLFKIYLRCVLNLR